MADPTGAAPPDPAAPVLPASNAPISWRRNQLAVITAGFIGFMGFTLVMPFLPLYFRELGVTDVGSIAIWSGVSLGVTPGVTAICAPVWGVLADRFGRKLMLVRSLASFIVVMAAMAFVTAPWQVLALRAAQGLFAGFGALTIAMVVESVPSERVARSIGLVQTWQRLAPAIGPAVGGVVAQLVGLRQAFLVSSLFYVLALGLVVGLYREPARTRADRTSDASSALGVRDVLRFDSFPLILVMVFVMQLTGRSLGPILPLFVEQLGEPLSRVPVTAGILFSIVACAGAAGHHVSGRLLDHLDARLVIGWGVGGALVGFSLMAMATGVVGLFLGAPFLGAGTGVAMTGLYARASHAIPAGVEGRAFGVLTSASLSGNALSLLLAGVIGAASLRAVFVVDVVAVACLLYIVAAKLAGHGGPLRRTDARPREAGLR